MPLKVKFNEGEQILCFHGPLLYQAKCLKVEAKEKVVKYLVHYSGWSKSWDEWVLEARIMKLNDVGLSKQKELQKAHSVKGRKIKEPKKSDKKGQETKGQDDLPKKRARQLEGPTDAPKRKKAKTEGVVVEAEEFSKVEVKIPKELKAWLVDDWDLVTRQRQIVPLPASTTVKQILDAYLQDGGGEEEIVAGVMEYFNVMLGTQLLYKQERPQYADLLLKHPQTPMTNLYGAQHLLRLFVSIGAQLSYLDVKSVDVLLGHFHHLLNHLLTHSADLFSAEQYIVTPPDHIRKVL